MKKQLLSALIALLLAMSMSMTVFADGDEYIHGYFRYQVGDQSVTITSYTGKEETVTIPAMIGGNPVNTIASGAFADNDAVKEVHLPDTIMSVEDGAFHAGQTVIYPQKDTGGNQSSGGGNALSEPVGIRMDNGNLITIDDQGNLVMVDGKSGVERVLDDSQTYQVTKDSKGNTVIKSKDGSPVTVGNGGSVSYKDADRNQVNVTVDQQGNTTINKTDPSGNQENEELDVAGDTAASDNADADKNSAADTDKNTDKDATAGAETADSGNVWIIVLAVLVSLVAIAIIYRKKKRPKKS